MSAMLLAVGAMHRATASLGQIVRTVGAALGREYRTRRVISFLLEQDECTLRDLGIARSEVERVVRGW